MVLVAEITSVAENVYTSSIVLTCQLIVNKNMQSMPSRHNGKIRILSIPQKSFIGTDHNTGRKRNKYSIWRNKTEQVYR